MHRGNREIMIKELEKNENPDAYKEVIQAVIKDIEERVYWLNSSDDETSFLHQYWDKQTIDNDVLRKRLIKITEEKFEQFEKELNAPKDQPQNQLQVQTIENFKVESLIPDIPLFDPNYFSPNHPKTKQIRLKLKSINQDVNECKRKSERVRKEQNEKKAEKEAAEEETRRELQEDRKKKYQSEVKRNMDGRVEKQKERKEQNLKFKQFLKAYKEAKPMHVLMEEEYHRKFELPILEQNKKKLEEYKQKVKPTLEQINDHERTYLENKQCRQVPTYVANQTIDVPFKSKFYLQEKRRSLEPNEEWSAWDQVEKKKRYSELVQQNYKPKISMAKSKAIENSKLKTSFAKQVPDRQFIIEKGNAYMEYLYSIKKKRQNSSPSEQKSMEKEKHHYINYLQTLKSSRPKESKINHNWEQQLRSKHGNEYDRRQKVLMKSRKLQQKAYRQEQFVSTQNYGRAEQFLDKKKEIDETLIQSIKAKVAVLKDTQKD